MSGDEGFAAAVDDVNASERATLSDEEPAIATTEPDAEPKAFKIVHPKKGRPQRVKAPLAFFHLNVLAGLLGLMSLLFIWVYEPYYSRYEVFGAFRYLVEMGEYDALYAAIVLLIIAGSILCFVTSLGGLLLLGGVLLYAYGFVDSPSIAGPGPFVAVVAAFVGMASVLLSSRARVPARFATFVRSERGGLSVNVFAISAFALGLLSMVMCWVVLKQWTYTGSAVDGIQFTLLSFLFESYINEFSLMIAGAALVLVGSVVCLMTPMGSLLQAIGTVLVYVGMGSSFGDFHSYWGTTETYVAGGLYVAVVASLVGMWSMAFVTRFRIPAQFVPGMPDAEAREDDMGPADVGTPEGDGRRSRISKVFDRIPRMARVPAAAAMTLAVLIAAMSVPYALPLSTVGMSITNASADYVEIDVYVDGEQVDSGAASPYYGFMWRSDVKAGVHALALDYAYSSAEDTSPDGIADWSASVDVKPYRESLVVLALSGYRSVQVPAIEVSCSPSAVGYNLTFEEVSDYTPYGETIDDISWSDLSLVIASDSGMGVGWSFSSSNLEGSFYANWDFGTEYLGDLGLNCTAFDLSGDGEAGVGDFLELVVVAGEFSESSEYVAYLIYDPYDAVIGQVVLSG